MIALLEKERKPVEDGKERHLATMIAYLRQVVLGAPDGAERFHVVFVDRNRNYLTDLGLGSGSSHKLSLRMRDLFARALETGAAGIIVAHNHPSGICRPSSSDIESTRRLGDVAKALDIELIDHLIFTQTAIYSMRAGGKL